MGHATSDLPSGRPGHRRSGRSRQAIKREESSGAERGAYGAAAIN
ncbi:hypothetical protein ACFS32_05145 [Novosphingobium pokkalii]